MLGFFNKEASFHDTQKFKFVKAISNMLPMQRIVVSNCSIEDSEGCFNRKAVFLVIVMLLTGLLGTAIADGPYDYAARWKAWDANSRAAYVSGVRDGHWDRLFYYKSHAR